MAVSYKPLIQDRMADALNVVTNQKILETRPGTSRYNATAINANEINSITYFKNNAGTIHVLAKVQQDMFLVPTTGSATHLAGSFELDVDALDETILDESGAGLTAAAKHRGVTFRGRHIVAVKTNGLFTYDGTTWSQLGQAIPGAPTVAASGSGNTLSASDYKVAYTFYDSTNGFETNQGTASTTVTVSSGEQIDVSAISTSADNGNIDKVRIYIKDVTAGSDFLFWAEIDLTDGSDTIDSDTTSTSVPPTKNAPPKSGGAQFLTMFGNKLAYSGNTTFPSDVFLGTADIPDAVDDSSTGVILFASGQGPVTGLGTGFYSGDQSAKVPFLCIFKRTSIEVYDTTNGISTISSDVGAPSGDTIREINGAVFFQSTIGWHVIVNGRLQTDKNSDAYNLGEGDIDDIFTRTGFTHSISKGQLINAFSVYYPTLNQYMTFNPLAGSTQSFRSNNYELNISGFRPYKFPLEILDATLAENSDGEDIVLFATEDGFIMQHSIAESRSDALADNTTRAIETFFQLYWLNGEDMDATYNYGRVIFSALEQDTAVEARYFLDYKTAEPVSQDFDFSGTLAGFQLDVSKLDEGVLFDGRTIITFQGNVDKTAKALLLGFYQNTSGTNINMLEGMISFSKNGTFS